MSFDNLCKVLSEKHPERFAIAFHDLVKYTRRGTALPCPYTSRYYLVPHLNGNRYSWVLGTPQTSVKVLKTELSIEPIRADYVTFLQLEGRILPKNWVYLKPRSSTTALN